MKKGLFLLSLLLVAVLAMGCEETSEGAEAMASFGSVIAEACGGHVETWTFEAKGRDLLGRERAKEVTVQVTTTCFLGISTGYKAKWGFFGIEEEEARNLDDLHGIVSRKIRGE